jgi:pyridoxamine 5'-phosphate oxidase family protein
MVFTKAERDYLITQRLGRLATVQPSGAPQNNPVGYDFNAELETIDIFGWDMSKSRKYRNIVADGRVAFVVDDIASYDPWAVRGLEIRGEALAIVDAAAAKRWRDRLDAAPYKRVREFPAADEIIRVHPRRIFSWGIEEGSIEMRSRNVQA